MDGIPAVRHLRDVGKDYSGIRVIRKTIGKSGNPMKEDAFLPDRETIQFVAFELADEIYCAYLDAVQEVIRFSEITRVPRAASFVEGVINLRGFVIPIVDMRKRFGLGQVERTKSARIIILEIDDSIVGAAVDRVRDVINVPTDDIEPPSPIIRNTVKTDYLEGFFEYGEDLAKVLDLKKIFSGRELDRIREFEEPESEVLA